MLLSSPSLHSAANTSLSSSSSFALAKVPIELGRVYASAVESGLDAFWKRKDIFALMYLIPFDIFDGVKQTSRTLAANRTIADGHHIVSPASAGHCWLAFLAVHLQRHTEKRVDSNVAGGCQGRGVRQSILAVHVSCGEQAAFPVETGFVVFEWNSTVIVWACFQVETTREFAAATLKQALVASRASRAIIIFDEAGAIFRHGVRAKKIVEIIIFCASSYFTGFVAIRHLFSCVARDFGQRVIVHRRRSPLLFV
ncbi:hypothetical protein KC356_g234 [Hortaea werneckii]|nr:hypothetical protein KC356_g234 [Hortaea werneckii]